MQELQTMRLGTKVVKNCGYSKTLVLDKIIDM